MRKYALILLLVAVPVQAAIRGVVVDQDGAPLTGVTVAAYAQETRTEVIRRAVKAADRAPLASTKAGEDGSFSVATEGRAVVVLVVTAEGRELLAFDVADGDDTGTLLLRKTKAVSGKVTAEGKPVAGATVIYNDGSASVRTGDDGSFSLPRHATEMRIGILHPQWAPADLTLKTKQSTLDVALDRGSAVRGRVLAPDGRSAVAKATIFGGPWIIGETAEDGTFALPRVPAKWRTMRIASPAGGAIVTNNGSASYDVRLRTPGSFTGVVRDAKTNAPVAGVRWRLPFLTDENHFETAITNAKGEYAFRGLAPGRYGIYATHPLYAVSGNDLMLNLAVGENDTGVQSATPLVTVRGKVVDEAKKPVGGVTIVRNVVFRGRSSASARPAITAPDGTYVLRTGAAPDIELQAARAGYASVRSRLAAEPGETKNVFWTLPGGVAVTATVRDVEGTPVPEATLLFRPSAGEGGSEGSAFLPACGADPCTTGADGTVSARVVAGKYDIGVTGDTVVPKQLTGQSLDARNARLSIEVERGVELSGRVLYTDQTPVSGAMVRLVPHGNFTEAREDGSFSFLNAPRGTVGIVAFVRAARTFSEQKEVQTPAADVIITLPRGGRIAGRVVDAGTRDPVADFSIFVARDDAPAPAVPFAADDGRFLLEDIQAGTVTLHAVAAGYARATVSGIEVAEGKSVEDVELPLQRAAHVKGRVTGGDGKPLEGVSIFVREQSDGPVFRSSSMSTPSDRAVSDADGAYGLASVPPGEQTLTFTRQGFARLQKTVEAVPGKELRLDVTLDAGRTLKGRVLDEGGRPVGGARVQAIDNYQQDANGTSDTEGNVELSGLAAKEYEVQASKEGFVTVGEQVHAGSAQSFTLVMRRGAAVSGRVTGLPAAQLPFVAVYASARDTWVHTTAAADGTFTLRGLPDGEVEIQGSVQAGTSGRSAEEKVMITGGSAPFVELRFVEGFEVQGRVTRAGAPLANVFVGFSPKEGGPSPNGGRTSANGTFTVTNLTAGTYRVAVHGSSGMPMLEEERTLSGPVTLDLEVRGATVRGRVFDVAERTPIAGAVVTIEPEEQGKYFPHEETTDSHGRFTLPFVAPGRWSVRAQKDGYRSASQKLTVGESGSDTDLYLERGTAATIHLVDAVDGHPVVAFVALLTPSGEEVFHGESSSSGVARVWAAPGAYKLSVFGQGYVRAESSVTIPGPEVRVPLGRAGSIEVVSRRAFAHSRVSREGFSTGGFRGRHPNLVPGTYAVELRDEREQVLARKDGVVVSAGQTTTVTFD